MSLSGKPLNLLLALIGIFSLLALYPLPLCVSRLIYRAESAFAAGDYRAAAGAYRLLADGLSGTSWPLTGLIEAEALAGHYSEAIRLSYLAAERFGWWPGLRRLLADAYIAQGRPELAIPHVQSPAYDIYLGWHLWGPALAELRDAVGRGEDGEALCTLAVLEAVDAPGDARRSLESALGVSGCRDVAAALLDVLDADSSGYPAIALVLMEHGRWDVAIWAWDRAIEAADGGDATFWAYRGLCRERSGLDGLPDVTRGLILAPDEPLAWYALGICRRDRGDTDGALEAFSQACVLDPANPAYPVELGSTYRQVGRLDLAALWLRAGFSLAPDSIGFRRVLAAFYAEEGYALDGEGMAFVRESASLYPDDAGLRASLGLALLKRGDYSGAVTELERALELDPGSARAAYYLGMAREAIGATDGAADAYRLALSLDPEGPYGDAASLALERMGLSR